MNQFMRFIWICVCAAALAACGGGGGSGGTPLTGAGSVASGATTASATLSLTLVDTNGAVLTNNALGTGVVYARALVADATGLPVANKLVTFTLSDPNAASLTQPAVLTDSTGVARTQISAKGLGAAAAPLTATAALTDAKGAALALTQALDFQTSASNVALSALTLSPASLNALQTSAVSVKATVNGAASAGGAISVSFAASCGSFSPATAATNNLGVATSTYQSTAACSGPVSVSASASGSNTVTATIQVAAVQPANLVFSAASTPAMVLSSSSGGVKQSTLKFQVLDSAATGMAGQDVTFSLSQTALNAGVTFSVGGVASTALQTVSTDATGFAQVTVSAGTIPTPVVVTAQLKANPAINASSTGVSVSSGRAAQDRVSLSVDKFSIEGYSVDGTTATLTMRVADHQGNPIPIGTVVSFVSSYGWVGSSTGTGACTLDANSQCTVTHRSQGTRPSDGRVVVLGYLEGEEAFVDTNQNNIWDAGESFTDLGTLFRDDNRNSTWDSTEPQYLGGQTGAAACATNTAAINSVANTCDGTWSSNVRVRYQTTLVWATSAANITPGAATTAGFLVTIADKNGNAMPTGSTVSAVTNTDTTTGTDCKASANPDSVVNSLDPTVHSVNLVGGALCKGRNFTVSVKTPLGVTTAITVNVP